MISATGGTTATGSSVATGVGGLSNGMSITVFPSVTLLLTSSTATFVSTVCMSKIVLEGRFTGCCTTTSSRSDFLFARGAAAAVSTRLLVSTASAVFCSISKEAFDIPSSSLLAALSSCLFSFPPFFLVPLFLGSFSIMRTFYEECVKKMPIINLVIFHLDKSS
jgi:hypothetical protein